MKHNKEASLPLSPLEENNKRRLKKPGLYTKTRKYLSTGLYYVCGCKPYYYETYQSKRTIPLRIHYGCTFESDNACTRQLMKAIAAGYYGSEWQELLANNPNSSIDERPDLYTCDNCGFWINEENLSFYLPAEGITPRNITVFKCLADYKFHKEYSHFCPKCGKEMKRQRLKYLLDYKDNTAIVHSDNMQQVYDLHLICPICKREITLFHHFRGKAYTHDTYIKYNTKVPDDEKMDLEQFMQLYK